ncbi:MAG: right-handed parallel beta-helix repeat-containing protein [Phycisphaerales bacterium]
MRTPYLLISLALCLLSAVAAGDDISPAINEYAVYTDGAATLAGRTHITGQLGADGSLTLNDDSTFSEGVFAGGSLTARYRIKVEGILHAGGSMSVLHDSVIKGTVQAGGSMSIADRVNIGGDVYAAGAMSLSPHAIVGGEVYPYTASPNTWVRPSVPRPDFLPGNITVKVNNWQSRQQDPGNYGSLELGFGSTIQLSSGDYHFSSINAKTDSVFQIDDSDGPVNIYVSGTVLLDHRAVINLASESPGNLTWFVGGNMTVRTDINLPGHVRCFGTVAVADRVHSRGSIYAKGGFSDGWDCTFKTVSDPSTYFVSTRGSDSNSGHSPDQSLRTIQSAINKCVRPGSTVYVAPGTYRETVTVGTGAGSVAVTATKENPTRVIADTTGELTGSEPGRVIIDGRGVQTYGIRLSGIAHWVFDGFEITGQKTYAVYADNSGISVTNAVVDVPPGYGVYMSATADVTIADCVFTRNHDAGGLMWIMPGSGPEPFSIVVTRNDTSLKDDRYLSTGLHSGWRGQSGNANLYGIVLIDTQYSTIERIEISNNQFSDLYLPIFCFLQSKPRGSGSVIANNTIVGSHYSIYAYGYNGNILGVINNIVDRCYYGVFTFTNRGTQLHVAGLLENEITYPMSAFGRAYEADIISASPMFTDGKIGDFSLKSGSPAVDAGTSKNAPGVDINGRSRPSDGDGDDVAQVDLGAHEWVTAPDHVKVVRWREVGAESER